MRTQAGLADVVAVDGVYVHFMGHLGRQNVHAARHDASCPWEAWAWSGACSRARAAAERRRWSGWRLLTAALGPMLACRPLLLLVRAGGAPPPGTTRCQRGQAPRPRTVSGVHRQGTGRGADLEITPAVRSFALLRGFPVSRLLPAEGQRVGRDRGCQWVRGLLGPGTVASFGQSLLSQRHSVMETGHYTRAVHGRESLAREPPLIDRCH